MNFREMLKNKLDAQAAIVKAAIAAGRAMTEDEQKQYDDLEVEIKNLERTIEAQEKIEKQQAAANIPATPVIYATPKNPDEKKWNSLGEYLQAVSNAAKPNAKIDNRLGFMNAASGLNEGIASEGGFLLDSQFVAGLQEAMTAESVLAKLIRMIPIGDDTNRLKALGVAENSRANGSRWGGVQAYWLSEADTVTAS
jgi:HK97 family phage major capsid protein